VLYHFSLGPDVKPLALIPEGRIREGRKTAPVVEQYFQSGGREPFGRARFGWGPGEPFRKRSLYRMSGEYFRREMHREFFFEAIAFAVIVFISAWALTSLGLMLLLIIR
jgi:hypothetical protein